MISPFLISTSSHQGHFEEMAFFPPAKIGPVVGFVPAVLQEQRENEKSFWPVSLRILS